MSFEWYEFWIVRTLDRLVRGLDSRVRDLDGTRFGWYAIWMVRVLDGTWFGWYGTQFG